MPFSFVFVVVYDTLLALISIEKALLKDMLSSYAYTVLDDLKTESNANDCTS